jgi:hypothetical protein
MFSIRYNRATNHIAGIGCKTQGPATDRSAETGVVAYYAENACGVLTRGRLAQGASYEGIQEALDAARITGGRKVCKTCEKAALALIEAEATPAPEQAPVVTVTAEPDHVEGAEHQVGDELYFLPGQRPHGYCVPAGPVVVTKVVDHVQATAYAPRFSYVVQIPGVPAATQGTDASELHAPGSVPVDYRFPETYDKAVCADCHKSVTYANTKIVSEPIHRDGPVYPGMCTRRERRVCVSC